MTQHSSVGQGYWSGSRAKKHRAVIVMVSLLLRAVRCTGLLSAAKKKKKELGVNGLSEFIRG